jgi:energy-coupling factor transporter transmembrane protein EcfT
MLYIIILLILLAVAVIAMVIWIAYSVSVTYQQTLTFTVPFENTFRYNPHLNRGHNHKLDFIRVTVAGTIKRDPTLGSTIVPGDIITNTIRENIITPYKDCLLMHESNTFIVEENILKRCPIVKDPSIENLSIIFFNKLAPIMPKLGCQLVSVKLISEGLKVTHARHKLNHYKM